MNEPPGARMREGPLQDLQMAGSNFRDKGGKMCFSLIIFSDFHIAGSEVSALLDVCLQP